MPFSYDKVWNAADKLSTAFLPLQRSRCPNVVPAGKGAGPGDCPPAVRMPAWVGIKRARRCGGTHTHTHTPQRRGGAYANGRLHRMPAGHVNAPHGQPRIEDTLPSHSSVSHTRISQSCSHQSATHISQTHTHTHIKATLSNKGCPGNCCSTTQATPLPALLPVDPHVLSTPPPPTVPHTSCNTGPAPVSMLARADVYALQLP